MTTQNRQKSNAKKIIWSIKPINQHEFRSVKLFAFYETQSIDH